VQNSRWLADHDVEFIEQPVPAEDPEGLQFAYERSELPIAADESCITLSDIPEIADKCDIANLKLMKCGGLLEAKRMIHAARAEGLEVMLGCMIESNASIAAGVHLGPLLDYADLDGSLLLDSDPYDAVDLAEGEMGLAELGLPGTGAREA
jgi:L-alanine-DL-glutamate epimerase-like enolase superfamily enzyme